MVECSKKAAIPSPNQGERPTVYADRVGEWYAASKSDRHRKEHGLYLTPVIAADFMAGQINVAGPKLRVLDPAAGAGVLCCAAVEALIVRNGNSSAIELAAYEFDQNLISPLRAVLEYLADWCRASHGVTVSARIEAVDFIMAHAQALRLFGDLFPSQSEERDFDVVISNPPYFKIAKADPRAVAASAVVHGQPNIYALFMAVGAALLREHGQFVFITPRSFASGPYFRRFRTVFFDMIQPVRIHVFKSRRDAFSRDEVLQENVIFSGVRRDRWYPAERNASLEISSSRGVRDLCEACPRKITMATVLDLTSTDKVLRLPICGVDDDVLSLVDSWPSSLHELGLNISTGPVVPFRATELVHKRGEVPDSHVPLLWMNHVRAMRATWPLYSHKPEYIRRTGAEPVLVPNRNYVLIRRFSAKEESRRLTAAPYIAANFAVPAVGFENHLNYIHRPGGTLSEDETWGLAALYNSQLLDIWFRAINGNTQVSATELRSMRLPARQTIVTLGRHVKRIDDPMDGLDELVIQGTADTELEEAAVG